MTFLEIEAFLKIAQCGSFSAAAEKLYITQPALGPSDPRTGGRTGLFPVYPE